MASSVKESDVSSAGAVNNRIAAGTSATEETAPRPQPVALEVAVTVNGVRSVEGSEKREPFSETTKTVLIFANGAVIRLASSVAPGQLLFLTNENSKREVVCQVVKSKNYRNVSGYVELEFTEAAPGFWGMRFPGEKSSAAAQTRVPTAAAPSALNVNPSSTPAGGSNAKPPVSHVPSPVPMKTVPPPPLASKTEAPKPSAGNTVPAPPANKTQAPPTPVIDFPRGMESKPATFLEQPHAKFEPLRQASDTDTKALRQEAARLQEQLSSLLFAESAREAQPPSSAPKTSASPQSEIAGKIQKEALEVKKNTPPTALPTVKQEVPVPKSGAPVPRKATLDLAEEEVKIPAWLEPLARNAAAHGTTPQEVSEPEQVANATAVPEQETAKVPETTSEGYTPTFGGQILLESKPDDDVAGETRRSGRGLLIGALAAGLVLATAAGAWYYRNERSANTRAQTNSPAFATLSASAPATPPSTEPTSATPTEFAAEKPPAGSEKRSAELSTKAGKPMTPVPLGVKDRESVKLENKRIALASSLPKVAATENQPKRPILGDVQLAAPVVNSSNAAQTDVAAPGLNLGRDPATSGDGAGVALMAGSGNQPKAPVPIGGDVKPARLIHVVSPMYPALARSQHVSGDVLIDAFIDATGRVTSMKIISGPVLLHQAAGDALRQWRYQPAMLDGKPVPMHLTVKVQFRVQQ